MALQLQYVFTCKGVWALKKQHNAGVYRLARLIDKISQLGVAWFW